MPPSNRKRVLPSPLQRELLLISRLPLPQDRDDVKKEAPELLFCLRFLFKSRIAIFEPPDPPNRSPPRESGCDCSGSHPAGAAGCRQWEGLALCACCWRDGVRGMTGGGGGEAGEEGIHVTHSGEGRGGRRRRDSGSHALITLCHCVALKYT